MDRVSSAFPEVYENVGIDTNKVGCIKVDAEPKWPCHENIYQPYTSW